MKKNRLKENQRDIPFEIQEEIMKRLPVKSLIRYRSVSKPCKSLIDSRDFIRNYRNQTNHLLVKYRDPQSESEKYVSIVDDVTFPRQKLSLFPMSLDDPSIVGSSQGLFCFFTDNNNNDRNPSNSGTIVLWNPSVGKSVVIDVPNVLDWPYRTSVGFAVCPRTHVPKFLKFSYIIGSASDISIPFQVKVLTLSSGGGRGLENSVIQSCSYVIISFNVSNEEFSEIYLPDRLSSWFRIRLSISKLRESLVVIEYNYATWNHVVWMMDHGDPNSFTKLFTIKTDILDVITERVLGFKKNGEAILEIEMNNSDDSQENRSVLFVYDPCTPSIVNIGISGEPGSFFNWSQKTNDDYALCSYDDDDEPKCGLVPLISDKFMKDANNLTGDCKLIIKSLETACEMVDMFSS